MQGRDDKPCGAEDAGVDLDVLLRQAWAQFVDRGIQATSDVNRVGAILCRNHQDDRWTALDRGRTEGWCCSFGYMGNIAEGEICALPLEDYGIR